MRRLAEGLLHRFTTRRLARAAALLALAMGWAGCETTVPGGGAGVRTSGATGAGGPGMSEGKRLYYGRCAACHAPEPVDDYTRAEWRGLVAHMRERAKLTPAEEASLITFLMQNAADS